MTETTQAQIDAVRDLCSAISIGPIRTAQINDWGRNGNFTVHIVPTFHHRSTTNILKGIVRRNLPKEASLRACFPPDAIRQTRHSSSCGHGRVISYSRNYWAFDIDFQRYDASSNSFSPTRQKQSSALS